MKLFAVILNDVFYGKPNRANSGRSDFFAQQVENPSDLLR